MKKIFCLLLMAGFLCLPGCSSLSSSSLATRTPGIRPKPTATTFYLAPIPQETFSAFRIGTPVSGENQALVAAVYTIGITRMRYATTPEVVLIEQTTCQDALKRVSKSVGLIGPNCPPDLSVWLIALDGEWEVVPPFGTPMPLSSGRYCTIINSKDGSGIWFGPCK